MLRKNVLVFSLLIIASQWGTSLVQGCDGWWTPRPCYYVANPCCCVPTCAWTCGEPCCSWSCCYTCYPTCRYYRVVPGPAVSACASCMPAVSALIAASPKSVSEKAIRIVKPVTYRGSPKGLGTPMSW